MSFTAPTISLAMMKIQSGSDSNTKLAALDCRILIRFDPLHATSQSMQAELIQFKMRVVFNIPEARHYLWSGYPSEPILAEAAARLLNSAHDHSIMNQAPEILESALKTGLLARGERGELVARALFTVAHDRAIMQQTPVVQSTSHFHRPLPLLMLLENLLAPDIWHKVRSAKPFYAFGNDPTLEDAFKNTWVNFSHFIQLGDHDSFTLHCASQLLKRGAAIQAYGNQYNMDGGLPLLHGDPKSTVICEETTSMAQYQIKNTSSAVNVFPEPGLADPNKKSNLPVISIIMQLGVEKDDDKRVYIQTTDRSIDALAASTHMAIHPSPTDIERRHYCFTLYGCTSKTYSCIPENLSAYSNILRAQNPFLEFPRTRFSENDSALYALKPMIYDKPGACMPW
jgi:hypothetical protein